MKSFAIPIGVTSEADFQTSIASLDVDLLNFDSLTVGSTISTGSSVGGITFEYSLGGLNLAVVDEYDTTSPNNYLGIDIGDGTFLSGEGFTMNFANTVHAIGLNIIGTPGDIGFADDLTLATSAGSVSNALAPYNTLPDGGDVFFLGLLDADGFDSVTISSYCDSSPPNCNTYFGFNVDDITIGSFATVPEPSSWQLMVIGVLLLLRQETRSFLNRS